MKIIKRWKMLIRLIALLTIFSVAAVVYAHGVVITYTLSADGEVNLYAEFDTGEVMAGAQVTVYSPEDPLTPWLIGTADAEGRYTFVIDPELPGSWDIQYRKAGHGDIVYLQLETGMINPALMHQAPGAWLPDSSASQAGTVSTTAQASKKTTADANETSPQTAGQLAVLSTGGSAGSSGGFTSLQIVLMSASVIWGFIGTALYFSGKKSHGHNHASGHHH